MTKNMGTLDRGLRLLIAAAVAVLYFMNVINGTTAIILGIVAVIFALTGLVSFCPLYRLVGISTCKVN